jgi:hypothetical protein
VWVVGQVGFDRFPQDWELISLFEGEPMLSDFGVPWVYNHLQFSLVRPNGKLDCGIEPANGILDVRWSLNGETCVHLTLRQVQALEAHAGPECEFLLATFAGGNLEPLQLQTKPSIAIRWGVRDYA